MSNINEIISKYKLTFLGFIAGGLLTGNLLGVIILGTVGYITDNF